jgi:Mg2+ and Co2+ transporter CorA
MDDSQDEIRDPNTGAAHAFLTLKRYRPSMFGSPVRIDTFQLPPNDISLSNSRRSLADLPESPTNPPLDPFYKSPIDRQSSLDSLKQQLPTFTPQLVIESASYDPSTALDIDLVIQHFELAATRSSSINKSVSFTPRYTFYSEKTGVVRSSFFANLDPSIQGISLRETLTSAPFWIDVCSPTVGELNEISRVFGLHPLTNEDIQLTDTREKCEVFKNYFFVVIRSFEQDQFKNSFLQPITVYIVIFEECILSV